MARRPNSLRRQAEPELLELTIAETGAHGDGIARHDGTEFFVPYTMPGDRVLARRAGPHHALPVEWRLRAGTHGEPPCRHFGSCGGCALQHFDASDYDALKRRQVETALSRRGFRDVAIGPTARTQPAARRRAEFAAMRNAGRVHVGFNAYRSPAVVDLEECAVLHPAIVALLPALRSLAAALLGERQTADVLVTHTDMGLDVLIGGMQPPNRTQREALAAFAQANDLVRVAWRDGSATPEVIVERRPPQVTFAGTAVNIPPGAFLQASPEGEAAIVAAVTGSLGRAKRVADLYAGCGTLTFPLARHARVHAVEGAAELAEALGAAARRSGQAGRVTIERRDLSRRPLLATELDEFDTVVFDPPRDGAALQASEIARSRVPTVIGASCNPATFARDARILADGGYRLDEITPVDQFLWSTHLELVGRFTR
jgi:23S rRNA (uracil1939-C5)-methyltransferase